MEQVNAKQTTKTLSCQIKDMALKASGAYRHCTPCANQQQKRDLRNSAGPEKPRLPLYRRTWSSGSGRKELEARLKVISIGDGGAPPVSVSGRRVEPVVFVEESEPKEWVAQVEPGVLITFLSLPKGGNDLKRVRFSQEMFNKWQAHRWWTENCEKVMELYNVQRLNRQAFPLPTTPISQHDMTPTTRPITDTSDRPNGTVNGHFPESLDDEYTHPRARDDSDNGVVLPPQRSSTSGIKSMDASTRTSSFRDIDRSGEMSLHNGPCLENEWVEQDEVGVYLTIRALPDGRKELRRVRFSREKFKEMHARMWWEENRERINRQYL